MLAAIVAASGRALGTMLACTCVGGFVLRRERGVALEPFDALVVLLALVVMVSHVHGIVRPSLRPSWVRRFHEPLPSTSWADVVVEGLLLVLGGVLGWAEWRSPFQGGQFGLSLGLVVVPLVLSSLRLAFFRRRPTR